MELEGVAVVKGDKQATTGPEAELKAAQIRATVPLEKRQEDFKAMLLERGVSCDPSPQCVSYVVQFCRSQHSLPGRRSFPSLCLTLATCCSP